MWYVLKSTHSICIIIVCVLKVRYIVDNNTNKYKSFAMCTFEIIWNNEISIENHIFFIKHT